MTPRLAKAAGVAVCGGPPASSRREARIRSGAAAASARRRVHSPPPARDRDKTFQCREKHYFPNTQKWTRFFCAVIFS